jgi:2-methylcitrate dehydratase PrpD
VGREIEELARFVAAAAFEDVPQAVRQHAKLTLLDTLGVILAGSERAEIKALRERLLGCGGRGATVFARGWPETDPRGAALLNGIAGRAIELCEGLRLASGQPAVQILPGLFAMGEAGGHTGAEMLLAFVLGYEVAARLSGAFRPRPLAHQNGGVSLIAAAAAGARMRGLDAQGVSRAMRIATILFLTPSYRNAVAGASALNVAGGMSGFVGTLAPELALAGFTAKEDAVEEALGEVVGAGFSPQRILDELGSRWEITRNYFRLYACCNPIHPALDCLKEILETLDPRPDQVLSIGVATHRFAAAMAEPAPKNFFASKYSLPHAAATMVVRGGAGWRELDEGALSDPQIAGLRPRVHIVEDEAMSARVPRFKPARVTVVLEDGREMTVSRESHRGDFYEPFAESLIRDKFRELAASVLSEEGARTVEAATLRAEDWSNVGELAALLRRHGR